MSDPHPLSSIVELLKPSRLLLGVEVSGRKRLFDHLSELLGLEQHDVSTRDVRKGLEQRERMGSTLIGNGVAVPHARIQGLKKPLLAAITLAKGVPEEGYESLRLAIGLIAPWECRDEAIDLLGRIASVADDEHLVSRLLRQKNPHKWCRVFHSAMA